jgi:hypothetical protein
MSAAQLRASMLSDQDHGGAEQHAEALRRLTTPIGDAAFVAFERRAELQDAAEAKASPLELVASELAASLLARSDDVAAELERPRRVHGVVPWVRVLRAAVGREANEGWPARLTLRWLHAVLGPSGLLDGLRLGTVRLPQVWGASSFARALAEVGGAALDAARPKTVPFALHQRPDGLRQAARQALMATMIGSEAFARRILALGRDKAREHVRRVALAELAWLRLCAMAALVHRAAHGGKTQAREVYSELSERTLGPQTPPSLFAALPSLSAAGGAVLLGTYLALQQRTALVERFEEDWFHNPRTGPHLRELDGHADEVAEGLAGSPADAAGGWAEALASQLEWRLG